MHDVKEPARRHGLFGTPRDPTLCPKRKRMQASKSGAATRSSAIGETSDARVYERTGCSVGARFPDRVLTGR